MATNQTRGRQVRDLLDMLPQGGILSGRDLAADDRGAVERWDDLTEALLLSQEERGRTVSNPDGFVAGRLEGGIGANVEGRFALGERILGLTEGAMFGFTEGLLGERGYWRGGAGGEWVRDAWGDFSFDPTYLLLEDEKEFEAEAEAHYRPFRTSSQRAQVAQRIAERKARAAAANKRMGAAGRLAQARAAQRATQQSQLRAARRPEMQAEMRSEGLAGVEMPTVVLEDMPLSAEALPALDAALRMTSAVWGDDATVGSSTTSGAGTATAGAALTGQMVAPSATAGRRAAAPRAAAGAPFSPTRFAQSLQVVNAAPTTAVGTVAPMASIGLGGDEQPQAAPVFGFAYDAATDVLVAPETVAATVAQQTEGLETVSPATRWTSTATQAAQQPAASGAPAATQIAAASSAPSVATAAPVARAVAGARGAASVRLPMTSVVPQAATPATPAQGRIILPAVQAAERAGIAAPQSASAAAPVAAGTPFQGIAAAAALEGASSPVDETTGAPIVSAAPATQDGLLPSESFAATVLGQGPGTAARDDRYGYASDFSALPSELFATSIAQRAADETPSAGERFLDTPGAGFVATGHQAAPGYVAVPGTDDVVYLSINEPTAAFAETVSAAGELRTPMATSLGRNLPASVVRRMTAPAVTVGEATRVQQLLAQGIQAAPTPTAPQATADSSASAVQLGLGVAEAASVADGASDVTSAAAPMTAAAQAAVPALGSVASTTQAGTFGSIARTLGASAEATVPRSLRNVVEAAQARSVRSFDIGSIPGLSADARAEAGETGRTHGLWLQFAGADPVFIAQPGVESKAAETAGVAGQPMAQRIDLAQRSLSTPILGSLDPVSVTPYAETTEATTAADSPALFAEGIASMVGQSAVSPLTGAESPAVLSAAPALGQQRTVALAVQRALGGQSVAPVVTSTLASARAESGAGIEAFAPTVARLLGVAATSGASPSAGYTRMGGDEVGSLVALERELATRTALDVAPSASVGVGRLARTSRTAPMGVAPAMGSAITPSIASAVADSAPVASHSAVVPEVEAHAYLPSMARSVTLGQRQRALSMASTPAVQRFLEGTTPQQLAQLSPAERRFVAQEAVRHLPAGLRESVGALLARSAEQPAAARSETAPATRSGDFWGGFSPRLAKAEALGDSAPATGSAMTRALAATAEGSSAPTALAATLAARGDLGSTAATGGDRWVRAALDWVLPELMAQQGITLDTDLGAVLGTGPGGSPVTRIDTQLGETVAARGEAGAQLGSSAETLPTIGGTPDGAPTTSRLAMDAPVGGLLSLPDVARAAATTDTVGGEAPATARSRAAAGTSSSRELGASRALRFAEGVSEQVLGAVAESSSFEPTAFPAAVEGRDSAGATYWPESEQALIQQQAERASAPGVAASPETVGATPTTRAASSRPRHGETVGERSDISTRDWAQVSANTPLAAGGSEVAGRVARAAEATGAAQPTWSDEVGAFVTPEAASAGSTQQAADSAQGATPVGFRPGLLREQGTTGGTAAAAEKVAATRKPSAGFLSPRVITWMAERGFLRQSAASSIAQSGGWLDADLLSIGSLPSDSSVGGQDSAGAPMGFSMGNAPRFEGFGGDGWALPRLLSAKAANEGRSSSGLGADPLSRSFASASFAETLVTAGGGTSESSGASQGARRFGGDLPGATVSMPGTSSSSAAGDLNKVSWGRVESNTQMPSSHAPANLGALAAATTLDGSVSRATLPLVVPVAQAVATQAAAKADTAAAAEVDAGMSDGSEAPDSAAKAKMAAHEKQKIKKVVDQVVSRVMQRIRRERVRRGNMLA